jgi:eukaryotic-like serine/threonine-protein kinase
MYSSRSSMTAASADRDSATSDLSEGTVVSGRYRIVEKIGQGQMGEVYRARRTASDAGEVALKVIRSVLADGKTEPIRRFEREAQVCAGLRHPNIVPVIDHGVWEHRPFLVMPVLSGSDLDSLIQRVGALPPDVAVAIAIGCARGLACAHEQRIVHRDFKPANVFLDESPDGSVTPVVCDFGVAKALDPAASSGEGAITATGAIVGTPLYMSPEQLLDSKRVDTRCDIWALGSTLYHMLAGRAPFEHVRTYSELLLAMRDEKVPAVQSFAPWVSPQLARVVHAMLLHAKKRIASIGEVIEALEFAERRKTNLTKGSLTHVTPTTKGHVATVALMPKDASELRNTVDSPPPADSQDAEPHDPFIGRTINNRYAVIARLGLGGMGAVYDATDLAPGRGTHSEVALKVMIGDHMRDTEAVKRFLREAKAAAKIANPYVAMVLDTGVDAVTGSPYLVMERLRGNDLSTLLHLEKALEPQPIVSLFLHACEALRAAHSLGIVHRDIKPSNLFLHETADGDVVLKVCDFGIAKQLTTQDGPGAMELSAELTRTGGLLGSPLYMSPEQAKSAKNVDARSDVFSLALSLHEALSGQRPWAGHTSMGEIIVAVCTQDVPKLNTLAPWVDPGLVSVIERGLQRDPGARYQSVSDLGDALRPYGLGGRTVKRRELVGVGDRRAFVQSEPSSARALTNQPVSITHSGGASGRAKAGIVIGGVALLAIVGSAAVYVTQHNSGSVKNDTGGLVPSAPASPPPAPFPLPAKTAPPTTGTESTTVPVPVPVPAPSVSVATTTISPNPKPQVIVPPKPSQTVVPVVSVTASAPNPAKSGRGGTATDLPP